MESIAAELRRDYCMSELQQFMDGARSGKLRRIKSEFLKLDIEIRIPEQFTDDFLGCQLQLGRCNSFPISIFTAFFENQIICMLAKPFNPVQPLQKALSNYFFCYKSFLGFRFPILLLNDYLTQRLSL